MGHADGEDPHRGLFINIFLVADPADSLLYIRVRQRSGKTSVETKKE